ncbi:TetR family transcriptional regulator [Cellulomonas chitinilytica]|uniref:TetR family transcriptional regulator n=1 Tax=Cellulomonas chitinilytica TaxID=398759 RepID=A0A919U206_9CELL|nr:TetR/AcrR family transcriptional regulator [Cellulomonas chitinilytica]GIG21891.1 TetR family transcriptional regulator [Cellulomonas chitinilytica]
MGRPRLHDDALRSRLLEAASAALADEGVGGLTVRDVAARAGTSTSAVYSLFGGRPELVRAVGDEAFARFADRLAAVPRTADPEADLMALGLAYRRYARDEPHFYRAMFGTPGAGAQDGSRGPMTQAPTFVVLRDAVATVLVARGAPVDGAERAALGLWALVHGLVELELDGLVPGDETVAGERYASTLRAAGPGLLAPT